MTEENASPEGEEQEFFFDIGRLLLDYPDCTRNVESLLNGVQDQNPTLSRKLCALFAIEIISTYSKPIKGKEDSYIKSLEWLKGEADNMQLVDATPDKEYTKLKQRERGEQ